MSAGLELRLRAALAARAAGITQDRLRPAVPPTMTRAHRPALVRAFWTGAVVAALVLVGVAIVPALPGDREPDQPATVVTPEPTPSRLTPSPSLSPSWPGPTSTPTGWPMSTPTGGPASTPTGGPASTPTGWPMSTPTGGPTSTPTGRPS